MPQPRRCGAGGRAAATLAVGPPRRPTTPGRVPVRWRGGCRSAARRLGAQPRSGGRVTNSKVLRVQESSERFRPSRNPVSLHSADSRGLASG